MKSRRANSPAKSTLHGSHFRSTGRPGGFRTAIFDAFGDALSRYVVLLFLFAAAMAPAKAAA